MELKKSLSVISFNLLTVLSFIFFIVFYEKYSTPIQILITIYSIILILVIIIIVVKKNRLLYYGVIIYIPIFALLILRILIIDNLYEKTLKNINYSEAIIGEIISFPVNKNELLEMKVKVLGIKYPWITDHKKVDVFNILVKIKSYNNDLKKGDAICIKDKISFPRSNINGFNYRKYLFYHEIYGVMRTENENITLINDINKDPVKKVLKKTVWSFRGSILGILRSNLNNNAFSFITSIFFGLRSEMKKETYEKFKNTGMIHLLAISGLHIGFIGLIFFRAFSFFLSRSRSLILSIFFLFIFIMIIMPSSSSIRAFLMYSIAAAFFIMGIQSTGINILSLTAIIMIYVNPYFIFDLGFQFSFLATSGILFYSEKIKEKIPVKIPDKSRSLIAVTFSAFICIFFLQWAMFSKVPLFSLVSSLIVVPLFGFIFGLLFFCIITLLLTKSAFISYIIELAINFFLKIIDLLDKIPVVLLPEIPIFFSYLFLIFTFLIIYIFTPATIDFVRRKKIFKLELWNKNIENNKCHNK